MRPGDWWQRAACRSTEADLFFPVSAKGRSQLDVARAKAVCVGCPVRTQCLHYALAAQQLHGIWGGLTEEERQHLAARPSAGSGQYQVQQAASL